MQLGVDMTSVQFYMATMPETVPNIGVFRRYHVKNSPVQYSDPTGTVVPFAVYPILLYTLWDAAISSTYVEVPHGGVLTIPPPILWKTAIPGLWGAQVTFKTKEFKGILYNWPSEFNFLVPKPTVCTLKSQEI